MLRNKPDNSRLGCTDIDLIPSTKDRGIALWPLVLISTCKFCCIRLCILSSGAQHTSRLSQITLSIRRTDTPCSLPEPFVSAINETLHGVDFDYDCFLLNLRDIAECSLICPAFFGKPPLVRLKSLVVVLSGTDLARHRIVHRSVGILHPMVDQVEHEPHCKRFVLRLNDEVAFLEYEVVDHAKPPLWDFRHTFCPESMRGKGIAGTIVQAAFDHARENNIKVVPTCSYIPVWLSRHPSYTDVVGSP
jgi:uncharacterized protein